MRRSKPLTFYKMHSLGNDFMVIDRVTQDVELNSEEIARWGDRLTGIGFDQLLTIDPPDDAHADFWYRIYNTDGSEAEQCGNGTRCVSLLARHLKLTKKCELTWQSLAGVIHTEMLPNDQYQTVMTEPVLDLPGIPFDTASAEKSGGDNHLYGLTLNRPSGADSQKIEVVPVSMGNPHGVIFVDDIFAADVAGLGAELTQHPAFPEKANIGFCQVIDPHFVRLRVYERGVGETRACGSGACAAVVAGVLEGHLDERVKVSLPGGKLRIAWPGQGSPVTMTGNATLVYRGELADEESG